MLQKRIYLIIFFTFILNINNLLANPLNSDNKKSTHFASISMQKITESSLAFQNIKKQMEEHANSMRSKFDLKGKDIRKKESELEKKSKVLKPEVLKEEIEKLKKESQELNDELNNDRQKLEKIYFDTMNNFHKQVNDIISEYSNKNNIDVVLEVSNIIFISKNIDNITDKVIEIINKTIKEIKIKFN